MKYICIQSLGEMDPRALTLMGASTKRDDENTIGYFGSGNKSAIALLLRKGIDLRIFSGEREIVLTSEPVKFREQEFDVVHVDGQETSITTQMSPKWETWMAIRELVSNAMDEGGFACWESSDIVGGEDSTRFFVGLVEETQKVWAQWKTYFRNEDTAIFEGRHGRLLPSMGPGTRIYKRGILCATYDDKDGLYDYDLIRGRLNEEREMGAFEVDFEAIKLLDESTPQIKAHVLNDMEDFEKSLDPSYFRISESWFEDIPETKVMVSDREAAHYSDVLFGRDLLVTPDSWVQAVEKAQLPIKTAKTVLGHKTSEDGIRVVEPDQMEEEAILLAISILKEHGEIEISRDEVVIFETSEESNTLGRYFDEKIWVSRRNFSMGMRELVDTLVEEWAHRESKEGDETRGFESFFRGQIIRMLERSMGRIL